MLITKSTSIQLQFFFWKEREEFGYTKKHIKIKHVKINEKINKKLIYLSYIF